MKENTRKKYQAIAKNFNTFWIEEDCNFEIAVRKFLYDTRTKNTLRVKKAGIRYWIVGYCMKIEDKEKRRRIRKKLEGFLENIVAKIKEDKKFEKRKGYRYSKRLTLKKIEKIFTNKKINNKHKALIFILIVTGCRPSEIKNLKIFVNENKVIFEKIINKKTKKNSKESKNNI